jgi:N-acyl-D-amino-acid deacylase
MSTGSRMLRIMAGLLTALGLAGAALAASAQDYDLVILNGRVMDPETMLDATLNVGVKDGKIAVITKKQIKGKETIDAKGLVVAPGFIDTQCHGASDEQVTNMMARDGVTTPLDLEAGTNGEGIDAWYAAKKDKWPLNYGTSAGHEFARKVVLDGLKFDKPVDGVQLFSTRADALKKSGKNNWAVTTANLEQMNRITAILDEGLRQGAIGVASLPGYAPGISTYEMFEAQRAAARYGRVTAAHIRFHANNKSPTEAPLGFDELFTNAMLTGAPLLISHNNDFGWWEIEEKLQMARAKGLNMWSEYYPYTAGSTSIGSEFLQPGPFKAAGLKYEESLYDPQQDKKLTEEEFLKVVKQDPARTVVIFIPAREKWLPLWLRMPHQTVASDSMFNGHSWDTPYKEFKGHPRTSGSHGTVFRLGREMGVPLMHTLAQMSYWPAKHLGDAGLEAMQVRGRMQQGMVADITIFDPEKVTDHSTYKTGENGLPTTGIPYVIVNGKMVVKNSEFQKVWAGQPIRYPVESKGRFVPASVERWIETFGIETFSVDDSGTKPHAN